MAQTPAPGVQLYLYRLLTETFGTGRQALLPKVEEALAADGIGPDDLECADVRELMSALDFATITTFKGGRVYVTFAAQADFDEALAAIAEVEAEAPKARKGGKPWKRKRAALKPVRPQKRETKKPKHVREAGDTPADIEASVTAVSPIQDATKASPTSEGGSFDSTHSRSAQDDNVGASGTESELPQSGEPKSSQEGETGFPENEGVEKNTQGGAEATSEVKEPPVARTLAEILAEARAEEEAARAAEEAAAKAAEEAQRLIEAAHEAEDAALEPTASEPVRTQDATPTGLATPAAPADIAPDATHETPIPALSSLPRSLPVAFWDEVRCPDELLAELANLLPLDVDAHTLLEEDWKVARATGSLRHEGATADFDLRYASSDGAPISVALERGAAGPGGKRWVVTSIEGSASEDADWMTLAESSLAAEGAWADLSASRLPAYLRRDLLGEFAGRVSIGGWDDLCTRVANLAKPEPWGPADAGGPSVLREYLLVSLTRALEQGRLLEMDVAGTSATAIWNTGLVTQDFEPICCLFGSISADGTRPLVGLRAAEGGCLMGEDVPLPASYLEGLDDLIVSPGSRITVAPKSRIPLAVAERALRRAVASWREVVPVWDPQERAIKLLLPASTNSADEVDAALVVERDPDDALTLLATRVLPLDRAYLLARVVTDIQPAWLTKDLSA